MDHRRAEKFYAVVAPGLENLCAKELGGLGITPDEVGTGGISFTGKLRELYLTNLHLRTASRIVVRFAEFQSRDFPDLYRKALKLPWGRFVRANQPVSMRVTSRGSRLNHTTRIAETLESAINQALGRTTNPDDDNPQLVMVRITDGRVTLSIDSSGELLHRRGYRTSATKAPLRETLAAAALMMLDWDGKEPLADPMCGSGSFLLEGALIASNQAPGANRSFAFMQWPGYREGLWKLLCEEARRNQTVTPLTITGADENAKAVEAAQENCYQSGHAETVIISQLALDKQQPHEGEGLVISNPPYGKRLSLGKNPEAYYADLGKQLTRVFPGWRKALVCPEQALIAATGLPFKQIGTFDNGGLKVGLFVTEE